ncbi:MAG: DedA family protein [Patescibacteria group bacterium]|jgi:membrane protein DedA with SNARE-associated domain|nr:DedA family protein [Patescibacteria group bacterium]MCL5224028.1 DedA family protein [Patescibacteria group bacterium]
MGFSLLSEISAFILAVVSSLGYWGVFILMVFESLDIPIPSEVVLPFAGFLVYLGKFDIVAVILIAATGNLVGSLINYWLAYRYRDGAAALIEKWHLVGVKEINWAYRWFETRGLIVVFLGRLLPIVRTFISFPAGFFKVSLKHFALLTFIGSFIWGAALTYIGYVAGYNWMTLEPYFRQFDYLIWGIIAIAIIWEIARRIRK